MNYPFKCPIMERMSKSRRDSKLKINTDFQSCRIKFWVVLLYLLHSFCINFEIIAQRWNDRDLWNDGRVPEIGRNLESIDFFLFLDVSNYETHSHDSCGSFDSCQHSNINWTRVNSPFNLFRASSGAFVPNINSMKFEQMEKWLSPDWYDI